MIKYLKDYNPIFEYWEEIKSGREVVGDKIYRTYKKIVYDLENESEFFYSVKRANHIIEFCENYCKHSKGKLAGKPVILELWEKAMLATIFGFIDIEGNRKYREALLIIAKKNGKSLIASCVGIYLQIGDNEGGSEVYATATMKDQAKIVWSEAKRMVNKSPVLRKRIKPLVSEMVSDFNDGVFKPLASNVDTLDGKNVHGALMDEIHQWKNGKALYDIIADGTTAREQPLIFITSTAGTVREDLYDLKYDEATQIINGYFDENGIKDDRFIAFIYELDNRKEWTDEKSWKKANPGLGTIKNLSTLRHKVGKAKVNPMLVKNLVCKEFNIRETSLEAWLTFEQINNPNTFDISVLKPRYGIGGADLSSTTDLTSACLLFCLPNDPNVYYEHMYWLPEDLLLKRTKEDKIPYDIWHELGYLRTSPGNSVHAKYVKEWFIEMRDVKDIYLFNCGYDSWSAKYWVEDMEMEFGKECMDPVIQGKKSLSSPTKSLGADLESKLINYNNNPITKWCLTNCSIDTDKNDNIQLVKTSNPRRRIDGAVSMVNAYKVFKDKQNDYFNII